MKTLKILMIGHSLGNDATYLVPEVFKAHSDTHLIMGVLYHSGCRLHQHVSYLEGDAAQYAYYEFDSEKDTQWRRADSQGNYHPYFSGMGNDIYIEDGSIAQTMRYGITRHDWDIVAMQAGVFEAANKCDSPYAVQIPQDIAKVQSYVLKNLIDQNKQPTFVWNMTWSTPVDPELLNQAYANNLQKFFFGSTADMYAQISETLRSIVEPTCAFAMVMPSGTAVQNAKQVLPDKALYRDTIHASDFTRLMTAYIWYCKLTGADLTQLPITSVRSVLRGSAAARKTGEDYALTPEQIQILKTCAKNAMNDPYRVTPM